MSSLVSGLVGGITSMFRGPKAVERASGHITSGMQEAQGLQRPYLESGEQANTMLQNKLSTGELGGTFDPGDLTQERGYKFKVAEGQKGLDRRAVGPGGGGYFSSQALRNAQEFGQNLADLTYKDAYNRDLQRQRNLYDILSGQQSQGRQAAGTYGGYSTDIGNVRGDAVMQKENQRMQGLGQILSAPQEGMNDLARMGMAFV